MLRDRHGKGPQTTVNRKGCRMTDFDPSRLLRWLLPERCALCDAAACDGRGLCSDCERDLPRAGGSCPRCALPNPLDDRLCGRCQRRPPPYQAARVPFVYAAPMDWLIREFKFGDRMELGRTLAWLFLRAIPLHDPPEALIPIPLHHSRFVARGFNQSHEIARALARPLGRPVLGQALHRARATDQQTGLDVAARRRNVRGAFVAGHTDLPARVALIDDVLTTGATAAEASRMLLRAGVEQVEVWAIARTP